MNQFTKRLLVFGVSVVAFGSIAMALSQVVSYKPWGVPDSRRDEYDQRVAELDRQAELRATYDSRPRPIVRASNLVHDLGWVHPGESLVHVFDIENVGSDDLELKLRETSTDRVTAELETEVVKPGESTRCLVTLVAMTKPLSTPATQTVTLATNDPLKNTLVLTLLCQQRQKLVVPPSIDFGNHDLGRASAVEFLVYSQLGQSLAVHDIRNDDFDIEWASDSADLSDEELAGKAATAAHRVTLEVESKDYGRYNDVLEVVVDLDGIETNVEIPMAGFVRPPIGFYGPNVDRRTGINFGTVQNDRQHDLFVVVRSRSDLSRRIEVLDVMPKELQTELTPTETPGSYRLRVSIPEGAPFRCFNLAEEHGYVQVGDPEMKSYSNWLPVYGVVGDFK